MTSPTPPVASPIARREYRLIGADGGVFAFGGADLTGRMESEPHGESIVASAPLPAGNGYWSVDGRGNVFAHGDARNISGSIGSLALNAPIVGIAATPTGRGYWLIARDGGVFTFGGTDLSGVRWATAT